MKKPDSIKKTHGLIHEFKEFISRGSVIDLAVGVIIGGAFTAIVNSLVDDIIMPIVGLVTGGVNFASLRYVVDLPIEGVEPASINYGLFIQNIVNFLLTALVIFLFIRFINRLHRKKEDEPEAPAEPSAEVKLLTEIRDALTEDKK